MNADPLAERLAALLGDADPVPADVVQAAKASLAWRDLDTALASLVADSLQHASATRGTGPRLLTFETPDTVIDVEVSEVGQRLRLVGQVAPARTTRVTVEQPDGTRDVTTDGLGRFAIEDLAPGNTRFRLDASDGAAVRTAWIRL